MRTIYLLVNNDLDKYHVNVGNLTSTIKEHQLSLILRPNLAADFQPIKTANFKC